ncbi:MAG TPA: dUTP diphosphatase [Polyangiaceae bacterium]|nr:dUTP diphosphatase [Polyangiaceae bacterium]
MIRVLARRTGPVAVPLPEYQTSGAAGADLHAALSEAVTLAPGERRLIPTGLVLAIPDGYEGQVRPRSGLALKHGIGMVNAPGTIDSDYRGPVGVLLVNLGAEPYVIEPLARIGQLVIAPVTRAQFAFADELGETARGEGGFGSSGYR